MNIRTHMHTRIHIHTYTCMHSFTRAPHCPTMRLSGSDPASFKFAGRPAVQSDPSLRSFRPGPFLRSAPVRAYDDGA